MSDTEVKSLLGEVREMRAELRELRRVVEQAAHGVGFPRCGRHSERLKTNEASIELAHSRISAGKKMASGGLVAIAGLLLKSIWEGITKH